MTFGINKCATLVVIPPRNYSDPIFYIGHSPIPKTSCYIPPKKIYIYHCYDQ